MFLKNSLNYAHINQNQESLITLHAKLLQLGPTLCDPAQFLCPWDSPGKNIYLDIYIYIDIDI